MAVWSIIDFKHIQKKNRLDSEYYQPEYLKLEELMKQRGDLLRLQDVTSVIGGKRLPKGETFSVKGIPYVRTVDIKNIFTDFDKVQNIPNEIYQVLKRYQLKYKDILVTIVGSIGLIGYMQEDISPCNFTENCAVVRSKKVSPEFLLAVLISKIGQYQINREKVGTIQDKLALDRLRNFLIPKAKSKALEINIENNIKQANENYKKSKLLYSQAEQILLEELGLKNLDLKDDLFCTTTLKEVKDNNRMDTEYYMPKYEKLMEHIFNFEHIPLGKLAKFKKGVEPGSDKYFKTGKPFLRVSNLSKFEIINNNQKYLENNLYMQLKKSYEPKKGEILLSKDATPGVTYVLKESIEGIISSGILRLEVASSIKNEYLALVINSQVGQMQMKRDSGGSIINHWKIEEIKNLKVPLLADNTQEKIENLCCESFSKRKQAKQLLEQAKHKVEEMIEKGAGIK